MPFAMYKRDREIRRGGDGERGVGLVAQFGAGRWSWVARGLNVFAGTVPACVRALTQIGMLGRAGGPRHETDVDRRRRNRADLILGLSNGQEVDYSN